MPHFIKVFRLASVSVQPTRMLKRYTGHLPTGSGQRKNTTTTDKQNNQDDDSGNGGGTRDLPSIDIDETPSRVFKLEDNFIQVTKEMGMKWADLRAEYSKTQGEIGAIKWQIGVLLAAAAGAGSSLLAWLLTQGLSKMMQENQRMKTTEDNLYAKLDQLVQKSNHKHQQEASPVKKAGE